MPDIVPVHIPQENVNDETVKIIQWLVSDGAAVRTDQPLVEVETSKSTFEIQSPATGVIQRIAAENVEVPVGNVLCYIGESLAVIEAFRAAQSAHSAASLASIAPLPTEPEGGAQRSSTDLSFPTDSPPEPPPAGLGSPPCEGRLTGGGRRISRAALEVIRSQGLSESDFAAGGLVRQADVFAHLGELLPRKPLESPATDPTPRGAAGVPIRNEPLPRTKRLEARLLSWSRHAIRSTVTVVVPTCGLDEWKRREPAVAEFMSAVVIFESARLLRRYPHLNAYATDDQAHFYEQVNIGYALDAGRGLKVPVLREADSKSLPQLIGERRQFLVDYLGDSIRPAAMAGATFTVTDLSGDGVFTFDPLLVEAQSAILGVGAEFDLPTSQAGAYNLVLAFDHRLVEGRMAAQFLGELKGRLQAHEEAAPGHFAANPAAEPCCSRCLVSLTEIERLQGCLLHMAGRSKREIKLICSFCLAGF